MENNFLTWPDYTIIAIMVLSVLISLIRGFVREALSLVIWAIAIWVAIKLSPFLGQKYFSFIHTPSVQIAASFVIVLLLVVIIGAIVNHFVSKLIRHSGLSITDRFFGLLFGAARGVLLVGVLVLLGNMSALAQTELWQSAKIVSWFQPVAGWLQQFVPDKFKQFEGFSSESSESENGNNNNGEPHEIKTPAIPIEKWATPPPQN